MSKSPLAHKAERLFLIPFIMENSIELYDVTPRDGDQADGVNMNARDKVAIARMDDDLGIPYVEGGYPLSNTVDRDAFAELLRNPLKFTTLAAFGMTRRRGSQAETDEGLQALLASEAPALTIVGKSSRFQVEQVIRASAGENRDMIFETMGFLAKHRDDLTYDAEHFFDAWREDPVHALLTLRAALDGGGKALRRLVLCDTNGGTDPDEVGNAVAAITKEFPGVMIGIHPHNDRGFATANMFAAVKNGARHVQGTWNGEGERAGNLDLCEAIGNLRVMEMVSPEPAKRLTWASRNVAQIMRQRRHPGQPFVGDRAFAHKGGMHASGMERTGNGSKQAYEFADPSWFGNERKIVGSKQAGLSNVRSLVQSSRIIPESVRDKILRETVVQGAILEKMKEKEAQGFSYDRARASLELLALQVAGAFRPTFRIVKNPTVTDTLGEPAEARIKVSVFGSATLNHEVANGNGPVDALSNALSKALVSKFPHVNSLNLVDFHIEKAMQSNEGTASSVQVFVAFTDGVDSWTTTGVSTDMIEASFQAVSEGYEYLLLKTK